MEALPDLDEVQSCGLICLLHNHSGSSEAGLLKMICTKRDKVYKRVTIHEAAEHSILTFERTGVERKN